ncbi:MAG: pectate lyase [Pirellulaceae bacterium]
MKRSSCVFLSLACVCSLLCAPSIHAAEELPQEATSALKKATSFFTKQVASHGGYLYQYSADLKKREGEGKADVDTVWVQPPGTPAVGMALLEAYELSGEPYLLEAARAAGECLIQGQLRSGGWDAKIDFGDGRERIAYRVLPERAKAMNTTTFDDDKSQSALRLLIRVDEALGFKDERLHEAVEYALAAVVKSQFPNGAWPQRYSEFPRAEDYPVKKAGYPDSWSRTFPGAKYSGFYTFNDNAIADVIDVMFLAHRVYDKAEYLEAAEKAGGFILLAQMPEPQPAWAQQYDLDMHPAWARKFEPPAVTGGESQGILDILMDLYVQTGDRKYLEPIPRALKYLQRSEIEPGKLARFYELKTNRPLYLTKQYELTYDNSDMPTHYGFIVGSGKLSRLADRYEQLSKASPETLARLREVRRPAPPKNAKSLESQVREVIDALDERGAWVEDGELKYHGDDDDTRRVITSRTFMQRLNLLARYVGATKS